MKKISFKLFWERVNSLNHDCSNWHVRHLAKTRMSKIKDELKTLPGATQQGRVMCKKTNYEKKNTFNVLTEIFLMFLFDKVIFVKVSNSEKVNYTQVFKISHILFLFCLCHSTHFLFHFGKETKKVKKSFLLHSKLSLSLSFLQKNYFFC